MMIEPPIDALVKQTKGNIYVLANLISKRAKEIEALRRVELDENPDIKAINIACEEIYEGKVLPSEF